MTSKSWIFTEKVIGDYCCFSADITIAMLMNKNKGISLSRELINTFVLCKFDKKVFIVLPTGMVLLPQGWKPAITGTFLPRFSIQMKLPWKKLPVALNLQLCARDSFMRPCHCTLLKVHEVISSKPYTCYKQAKNHLISRVWYISNI